jgi:hydrogenase/urease accessory protein HupE
VGRNSRLGIRHILGGPDHLLFVLGLVLLVRGRRALAATVTAFTAGHSVTLSLAMLGVVHVPPAPVEALIAASIFVVAVELRRDGATGRRPWWMAGTFGLLHGLGFAGALAQVGLPDTDIPLALAAFNVGIEIGQLLFVAAVLSIGLLLRGRLARWRAVPAYGIGTLAAFWVFERVAALV